MRSNKIIMNEEAVQAYVESRILADRYTGYDLPENVCESIYNCMDATGFDTKLSMLCQYMEKDNKPSQKYSIRQLFIWHKGRLRTARAVKKLRQIRIHFYKDGDCALKANSNGKNINLNYEWAAMIALRGNESKVMDALKVTIGHEVSHKINDAYCRVYPPREAKRRAYENEVYNDYFGAWLMADGNKGEALKNSCKFKKDINGDMPGTMSKCDWVVFLSLGGIRLALQVFYYILFVPITLLKGIMGFLTSLMHNLNDSQYHSIHPTWEQRNNYANFGVYDGRLAEAIARDVSPFFQIREEIKLVENENNKCTKPLP